MFATGERFMTDGSKNELACGASETDWHAIAASQGFRDLTAIKKTFIVPAFLIFFIHYLALAVLVGYAPKLASTRVIGTVNIAYLFALSQFVVGWVIAALYLVAASRFDALTADILAQVDKHRGGE
jgi:uncharacterized membrane protein (DUF485 family)